ncbi:helix-turn-helix domain-containing protein [Actinomadura parmotrematis]|uniref:Helix-turn-helix transcriptional regulator n=1 Tax=Actinomadura parmotrematis TaxID=2864039 RepID=A0ABS7G0E1_9ACTN|nr:helix-turn-helix transcriptional regulator [Actinomadura parmotrematis]MBW8485334.1 helix-turn-helix transcriptional regulator [Actinomadura parmotrematis]
MPTRNIDPELVAFGEVVKKTRADAGLTQGQAAAKLSVTRSYISQVEAGHTRCRSDFAVRLDKELGANGVIAQAWNDLLEAIKAVRYPKAFASYPKAEATAVLLRDWEDRHVYGPFQTEAYARVLLGDDAAVAARMRRRDSILRDQGPLTFVVLDESVLRRRIGTGGLMREQLLFLEEISSRDRIYLQIAPIAYYRGVWGSFAIARQADHSEIAYALHAFGGETTNDPDRIARAGEAFSTLQALALNVDDSRELIREVREGTWT